MKKLILTSILMVMFVAGYSQTSFYSSYQTSTCYWNTDSKKFDRECSYKDESTMFKLNEDKTMFYHTTASISSAYYITSNEYDSDYDVDMYYVTSDVGNKYLFIVDIKNDQLRVMGDMGSDDAYLLTYFLKRHWTE